MNHCQSGDNPVIKYRFNNGLERVFKSDFAPIEVEIKSIPVDAGENYNSEGYGLIITSPQTSPSTTTRAVHDHFLAKSPPYPGYPSGVWYVAWIPCGESHYRKRDICNDNGNYNCLVWFLQLSNQANPNVGINSDVKCPSTNADKCSIIIRHQGQEIHKAQGECPINYEVQCSKCRDNEIECKKSTYPGYCCISCSEIRSGISSAKEAIRRINDG